MDEFDRKLSKVFKKNINYSNSYDYTVKSTLNNIETLAQNIPDDKIIQNNNIKSNKNFKSLNVIRIVSSVAACCILSFGIINSKTLSEKIYNKCEQEKNIEIAVNKGVSANFNSASNNSIGEIIDLKNDSKLSEDSIKISVDEVVMDDNILSVTLDVGFADEISKNIKYYPEAYYDLEIELSDLMITDEEGNLFFSGNDEKLVKYFGGSFIDNNEIYINNEKKNLNDLEKYYIGKSEYVIKSYKNGHAKIVYNMSFSGMNKYYPRSKKLNFEISKIKLTTEASRKDGGNIYNYSGNWKFSQELPDNIVSRSRISYRPISNNIGEENNVLKFDVMQTHTEIKLSLKTLDVNSLNPAPCRTLSDSLEIGEPSTQIRDWFVDKFRASEEYKKYEDDLQKSYMIMNPYIRTEDGKEYRYSQGIYANGGGIITEDNFYEPILCLDLTKEQASDFLELHFTYLEKEYVFKLEKEAEV